MAVSVMIWAWAEPEFPGGKIKFSLEIKMGVIGNSQGSWRVAKAKLHWI